MKQTGARTPEQQDSSLPKRGNAFFAWLLMRQQICRARREAAQLTPERRELLRRAKVAYEFAQLGQRDRLQAGSSAALTADLLRQSIYWAVRAQSPTPANPSPEAVWAAAETALLPCIGVQAAELAELSQVVRADFMLLAERAREPERRLLKLLRHCASRLIRLGQRPDWQLESLKLKRSARVVLLLLPILTGVPSFLLWKNRDLARGMPWQTSSALMQCHPETPDCGGYPIRILFHTKQEQDPWFEYDFGKALTFSWLTIRNRTDSGAELAVPLVVEVSNDHKTYREVSRRTTSFLSWRPHFATEHARYLRLRVLRTTYFHLEAIEVHP